MSNEKAPSFVTGLKEHFNEFFWERVGNLYNELEKLVEFQQLSQNEDILNDKLSNSLPQKLQETFFSYSEVVEQKFVQVRGFFYRMGFTDYSAMYKQSEDFTSLEYECLNKRVEQHFMALRQQDKFKELSQKETSLYNKLQLHTPKQLIDTLVELGDVVTRKYVQYQSFYYRKGFDDCAEYLNCCANSNLWILGD